ncbi:helix-turn-helix domain-containing protein [Thalassolituus sp. LLYu03]|uniref:AraC family transcriptional regulator n=1 Tax=Thalassolituus sp. LLYu03 TaxID=3421656 RepID=UPI003D28B1B2
MQAIWSAQVAAHTHTPVIKRLYSDGGSGLLLTMGAAVDLGGHQLTRGVYILPVKKIADSISMPPASLLCGIRFLPAVAFALTGQHYQQPTRLGDDSPFEGEQLLWQLQSQNDNTSRIRLLYEWATRHLPADDTRPRPLSQALNGIRQHQELAALNELTSLSQRQLERLFQHWLSMSPKQYQRIVRVRHAIQQLKAPKPHAASLTDIAHHCGFSDQAHMTREFRAIARVTPGKIG